jgi:hypothetical protein
MSQNFNTQNMYNHQEIKLSPLLMTFNEYYNSFMGIKDPLLENGWGWFVDIELNSQPVKIIKNNRYKSSQKMLIPTTIQEYPSIRSMKSMKNLQDTSLMFEMNECENNHRTNNNTSNIRISHWYLYIIRFINIISYIKIIFQA